MDGDFAVEFREFQGQCDDIFFNAFQQRKFLVLAVRGRRKSNRLGKGFNHTFAVYYSAYNRNKTAIRKRQHKAQRRHNSFAGIQENFCRNVSTDEAVYMRLYRLLARTFVDMDFVDGYVGVSLKYRKYRDRIFCLLFFLCCIVPSGYDIHAIRKTCAGFATVFQVLSVVVAPYYLLRFVRALA